MLSQLKYIFSPDAITAGIASGSLITLASLQSIDWTRFLAPGWFSLTLLLFMTGEIITCFYSQPLAKRKDYKWEEHVRTKLLIAGLGVVSLILDSIIIVILFWIPWMDGSSFPVWGSGFLPITLSTLLWLNMAEATRVVLNIAHSTGDENIPPMVIWVIRQLRRVDAARMPPGANPEKRMIDRVTEDDIRDLLRKLGEREGYEEPPPPMGKGKEMGPDEPLQ